MFISYKSIALNDHITLHKLDEFFQARITRAPDCVKTQKQIETLNNRFKSGNTTAKVISVQCVGLKMGSILVKFVYEDCESNETITAYSIVTRRGDPVIVQSSRGYNCTFFVKALNNDGVMLYPCLYSELSDKGFMLSNDELGELDIVYKSKEGAVVCL